MKRTILFLLSAATTALLFANVNNFLRVWRHAPRISAALLTVAGLLCALLAGIGAWRQRRRGGGSVPHESVPWKEGVLFAVFLLLSTLTTFAFHRDYHFVAWPVDIASPARALASGMGRFVLLLVPLSLPFLFLRSRRWLGWALPILFVAGELLCLRSLINLTGGMAIYDDDHASFLFRLQEFWHAFPWRENYVPHWNAGVVNSVLSSSGTPGYALLTSPLRLLFRLPHEYHTWGMALVHFFLAPWLAVWGMRTVRRPWDETWCAALLVLFSNRLFLLWTFSYGTIGAGAAMAMFVPAFLFLHAVAGLRIASLSALIGLTLSMFFLCQWPPMWLTAVVLAVPAMAGKPDRKVLGALALCGAIVLLLLTPTLISVFRGRELIAYTLSEQAAKTSVGMRAFDRFCDYTADLCHKLHPLTLVLGLGGVWLLPEKRLRRWCLAVFLGLALLYSLGHVLVPNMQIFRMAIVLGLLAVVPAACHAGAILRDDRSSWAPLQGMILALLVLGVANATLLYHGAGKMPFGPMRGFVPGFSAWVRDNVPENHRVLLGGRSWHYYGKGHVAYLPVLAEREMMACDYYEFPIGTYEQASPPSIAERWPGGVHGYLVAHGVSHVVARAPVELARYRAHPDLYEELPESKDPAKWSKFRAFRVKDSPGVLQGATGHVTADFNRIRIAFDGPVPEKAVLAYHWDDRLEADAPATIRPLDTGFQEQFIEVCPHGAQSVEIRYRPRF